ncbi:pilus assembly protein PilY [Pyxidicoccus sp. 3LFB2]
MRLTQIMIAAVALASAGVVLAQGADGGVAGAADGGSANLGLCIDTTNQDKQPNFSADAGIPSAILVTNDNPPKLRLNTNLNVLNPEEIILPFEQDLEALIVYDHAGQGASSTLGWFYYDELITAGYVNDNGTPKNSRDDTLVDANNNGIMDFHEDLYNVSAGQTNGRAYVGSEGARCNKTFSFTRANGQVVNLREPDLVTGTCGSASSFRGTGGPERWQNRAGYPGRPATGGKVGQRVIDVGTSMYQGTPPGETALLRATFPTVIPNYVDEYFSDRGLFPHIPNLLEPRHALNGGKGMGKFIFLATDDDTTGNGQGARCPIPSNTSSSPTAECLQPRTGWVPLPDGGVSRSGYAWDQSSTEDGVPDYKASAFDNTGRLITGKNPADAITRADDMRMPMGRIEGQREIVFFLVTYVQQIYGPSTDSCLITKPAPVGDTRQLQCDLWLHGDINVFFSKTPLNLDLHQGDDPMVLHDLDLTDWLGGDAYIRLANDPAYGGILFSAGQTQDVPSINRRAAHTVVGAPANNPLVWILGWEDQNAGGDRTYNDIVILINKQNNGSFRSEVVSDDISPDIAQDYTITEVTFTVDDEPFYVAPGGTGDPCTRTGVLPDGGTGDLHPEIRYEVALDCKVCQEPCDSSNPTYTVNPTPNWVTVPIPASTGAPRTATAVLSDFLAQGRVGTQLCWRAVLDSPGEACQPTINNINVSYKAQRSGQYGRASLIPMANAVIYGVHETPGRTWVADGGVDQVSTRTYDNRPDTADRGHIFLKKLYEPGTLAEHSPAQQVWDTGTWMRDLMSSLEGSNGNPLNQRQLLTLDPVSGAAVEVKDLMDESDTNSPAFPDSFCSRRVGTRFADYDLNKRDGCNEEDRLALRDWLYGWENRNASVTRERMRTWPLGGVNLSTAAVIGPPSTPAWMLDSENSGPERQKYADNFISANQSRSTVTYVGTTQGYLHALRTGLFQTGDDTCTSSRVEYTGYFGRTSGCGNNYGNGSELFAYLPYKLLPYYVENYRRANDTFSSERATMDATPAVADVDLRDSTYDAATGYNPATATNPWRIDSDKDEGAKTVLASATGPKQSVFFALDITNPGSANYPTPLWEFDMKRDRFDNNGLPCTGNGGGCGPLVNRFTGGSVAKPDTTGSRHSPSIARMDFGTNGGKKWIAMFATDFTPANNTVGTVYLMDIKTGLPARVTGTSAKARLAGVVTLGTTAAADQNEGIGGEPIPLDVDGDSNIDVIYVPSTSGKIYRINTAWSSTGGSINMGKVIASCVVADAKAVSGIANPNSQRIFSSISASVVSDTTGKKVRLYFGTGNNPDVANEPDDTATPRPRYHVMAFEDPNPMPTTRPGANCLGNRLWHNPLGPGQVVWGGVAATTDGVFTTTAVGRAAGVCDLDGNTSGRIYAFNTSGTAVAGNDTSLGGHGTHAPVLYDNHLIILNNGVVQSKGTGPYNNPTGDAPRSSSKVLIWDVKSGTQIQQVIP